MELLPYLQIIDACLLVLIWMVQLLIYPGFKYMNPMNFVKWHSRYTLRMTFIVAPLMLIQSGMSIYVSINNITALHLLHNIVVLSTWLSTFFMFIPLHEQLTVKHDIEVCKKLEKQNWLRVVLWTILPIISYFISQ